jgi:hypothetical protein
VVRVNPEQICFANLTGQIFFTGSLAVFASHIHGYFKETRDNIPYFITGGAGGEMLLSDPDHYFYHYIMFV